MQTNYKQVMRGIGDRRTQWPANRTSTSKSIPNTNRGKHKKKHRDRPKQDDGVTKQRSLLNKLQRKLFTEKIVQKEGEAYTPLYYHGLGWYKKNVISTYSVLL